MKSVNRNIVELSEISTDTSSIDEVISQFNETTVELNYILSKLTMSNLDGQIKEVDIPANGFISIPHSLEIIPAHRVILRQSGGGVIRDGNFTKDAIELYNDGSTIAKITVSINKG